MLYNQYFKYSKEFYTFKIGQKKGAKIEILARINPISYEKPK